ncbi:sulfatase-like hydrolase/transferase, partial [uncultured Cyclobacterium sp.]
MKNLILFGLLLSLMGCNNNRTTTVTPSQPNIIFIMVDDLGKEWVSHYGAENISTPNIDALAASGMTFHNVYSMPQCTPTRVTLLTG